MISKQELKNKLLSCSSTAGYYIDNEYLDSYINFIIDYRLPDNKINYTEIHHIQPRAYYKYNNLEVDNSVNNVVKLLYKDHIKAHYLLYFCTTGRLQQANACAVSYCLSTMGKVLKNSNLSEFDFDEIQAYMNNIKNDTENSYWTDNEIKLLYTLKPKKTNYKAYDLEALFPGRSYDCVIKKASSLGISIRPLKWSIEEDNILKKYFPLEGEKVAIRLQNRTKEACCRRARLLGLHHSRQWLKSEIDILQHYYSNEGESVYKRLPGRTKATCKMKAKELGLKSNKIWTADQLSILKIYYPKEGAACSSRIQKNKEACRQKANKLKIKYTGDKI